MYSDEQRKAIQDGFCRLIASGLSVKKACDIEGMPNKDTIYSWLFEDAEFSDQYTRARERRADARAERIDEICERVDTGELKPDAARVIIDAEKWQAGKENAKRYGDRLQLDGDMNVKLSDNQLDAKIAQLVGKAGIAGALGRESQTEEAT